VGGKEVSSMTIDCLLFGHEDVLLREPARLAMRCLRCDRRTTGWSLAPSRLQRRSDAAPGPGSAPLRRLPQLDAPAL
jgi:hypothetical protein